MFRGARGDLIKVLWHDGLRFRVLVIVDDCTRECLALVPDTSISGARVARELDRVIAWRDKPEAVLSDNVLRWETWQGGEQQISIH